MKFSSHTLAQTLSLQLQKITSFLRFIPANKPALVLLAVPIHLYLLSQSSRMQTESFRHHSRCHVTRRTKDDYFVTITDFPRFRSKLTELFDGEKAEVELLCCFEFAYLQSTALGSLSPIKLFTLFSLFTSRFQFSAKIFSSPFANPERKTLKSTTSKH